MTGQSVVQTDVMARVKPATRVCGVCNKTRLSEYNPATVCAPCERALFAPVSGRPRADGGLTAVLPGGKRQLAERGMPASPGARQ